MAAAAAAAVVTGIPAVLAGCASSSSGPVPAAGGDCPSPGVSGDTVKIGLIYPDSGSEFVGDFRAVRSGVDARVAVQNANGGIHGRKVEVVWRDDESNPAVFANMAHILIDNEKVFGLIVESFVAGPSVQWLDEAGVPAAGVAVDASWTGHKNLFSSSSQFSSDAAADTIGSYVRANGGTKAYVVADPTAPGTSGVVSQFRSSLQSQGVPVAGEGDYSAGASTPAHVVDGLRRSGADTLVGALRPEDFADIYAAAKAAGVRLNVALSAAGYEKDLLAERGADMAGMSVLVRYTPFEANSAVMRTYHTAMTTYSPELEDADQEAALSAYVSTDEMLHGLDLAGACPTRDAFITNLRQVTNYDAGGLIAPSNLSAPTAPATCFAFVKADASGTKFEPVLPAGGGTNGFWCGKAI
ncbi:MULTISPECIES: ABC transporter substrate-binding protein [unclassified Pseudofrankia]|uniref:ABC transporter substrate-binding protein n=1 Tax=unclassified Pseudofrankia TaxID=2994372 RepID=UPI001F521812|nr:MULTISPECIES: ABC transporter substrate-binding protein [unclassified Pseudofrankia]